MWGLWLVACFVPVSALAQQCILSLSEICCIAFWSPGICHEESSNYAIGSSDSSAWPIRFLLSLGRCLEAVLDWRFEHVWLCSKDQQRAQLSLNWIHRMNRCSTEPHFSNHERNDCFMCAQEALWNNSENWFICSLSEDSTRQIQLARIVLVDWWPAASSALVQSLVIEGWRMTGKNSISSTSKLQERRIASEYSVLQAVEPAPHGNSLIVSAKANRVAKAAPPRRSSVWALTAEHGVAGRVESLARTRAVFKPAPSSLKGKWDVLTPHHETDKSQQTFNRKWVPILCRMVRLLS